MRVPPVFATRQSFAGELTAPAGRNRRPPISAECRRVSLFLLPSLRACGEGASLMHPRREREPLLLARGAGLPTVKERSGLRVCGKVAGSSRPRRRWSLLRACRKCLAPERFACLFVLCPALQLVNRLFSLRPGSRLSGGVVSPAEVARGTFPRRTGKGAGSVGFALLNVPGRSRCSSSPGSFGLSSVPCSLPQRNWRALRVSACVLAAETDSRASEKAGKTGFPALFDERRPSAALRSEFSEFRPFAPAAISAGPAGRRTHAARMVCAACRSIPAGAVSAPTT